MRKRLIIKLTLYWIACWFAYLLGNGIIDTLHLAENVATVIHVAYTATVWFASLIVARLFIFKGSGLTPWQ